MKEISDYKDIKHSGFAFSTYQSQICLPCRIPFEITKSYIKKLFLNSLYAEVKDNLPRMGWSLPTHKYVMLINGPKNGKGKLFQVHKENIWIGD